VKLNIGSSQLVEDVYVLPKQQWRINDIYKMKNRTEFSTNGRASKEQAAQDAWFSVRQPICGLASLPRDISSWLVVRLYPRLITT
jgi:hypothetical protein